MIKRECLQCNKVFNFRGCKTDIESGRGKYCSRKCVTKSQIKHKQTRKCLFCKKKFKIKDGHPRLFCSKSCADKNKIGKNLPLDVCKKISAALKGKMPKNFGNFIGGIGEKNNSWKGGRQKHNKGYIEICNLQENNGERILEHRLVMEKFLKRKLTKKEVIHHINGKRDDNRIENLMLFSSNSEHLKYHFLNKKKI